MIDPHLFTLHRTYTGTGCAICGLAPVDHTSLDWLVNGEKRIDPLNMQGMPSLATVLEEHDTQRT